MISLLAAAAEAAPAVPDRLDPLQLFLDADIVVQVVMGGLLLASVWVWTLIVSFSLRLGNVKRSCARFEEEFWEHDQPAALVTGKRRPKNPSARVAAAGMAEFDASTRNAGFDRDGTRARIAGAMDSQVTAEGDMLADRLNFLATTGAVAPFVGLFGTVWGIMNSFFQIGAQQNTSLAVVAPGISEALFATAIGLFAAIPAVIAYNRFNQSVGQVESRLQRFADRVSATLSRELERR